MNRKELGQPRVRRRVAAVAMVLLALPLTLTAVVAGGGTPAAVAGSSMLPEPMMATLVRLMGSPR